MGARLIMSDEYDKLDELAARLGKSPILAKAWNLSATLTVSYAWWLLNHSGQLPPEIPSTYRPHKPLLRIWDNACGWTDKEPYTLTVFQGSDGATRSRRAIWHCKSAEDTKVRLIKFFENNGEVRFEEPKISVRDVEIPVDQLNVHLQAISSHQIPAISLQSPGDGTVTTDVGSIGFEFFSQAQPPAGIKYEWSDTYPGEWQPLIEAVMKFQDFLLSGLR